MVRLLLVMMATGAVIAASARSELEQRSAEIVTLVRSAR
jgi:hypothetical protein